MILTFGNEQELLDKLSDADRELALRDLILFGMYCVEEIDGKARRVDVRCVELSNGRIHRQTKVMGAFDPMLAMPSEQDLVRAFKSDARGIAIVDYMIRMRKDQSNWKQVWCDAARESGMIGTRGIMWRETSNLPIWKRHDPGAA